MRGRVCGAAICAAVLALPPAAGADGLPTQGVDAGRTGVTSDSSRYVTLPAGGDTVVARLRRAGGEILRSHVLSATFTVPAVALDGSASGLSADGRTLALIRPRARFPQRRTRIAVLDAGSLRLRRIVTLRGDFSFDALSPDGRSMYLIEYLSRRDPARYAVRAFDLRAGRLQRAPVVDPREPDERMNGLPITRATSADGRWAYTLYDGAGARPFVHALDTARAAAACIELDSLAGFRRLYDLRLGVRDRTLSVLDGEDAVAAIDRSTFAVRTPRAAPTRTPPAPPGRDVPWVLPAIVAAPLLLALVALVRRRRGTSTRAEHVGQV